MSDNPTSTGRAALAPEIIEPNQDLSSARSMIVDRVGRGGAIVGALAAATAPARDTIWDWLRKIPPLWASFIVVVVVPSLMTIFYLAFLASDQYVAEARFSVRTAQIAQSQDNTLQNAAANLASGAMPQLAGQDAHIVADYLRSRAAIEDLSPRMNLQDIFQRPGTDFWARLKKQSTAEEFQSYWSSMITTSVDGPSGIVTITARAFRPDDAKALAEACVEISESLVNKLSERARNDALREAEAEVRRTEGLVRDALVGLRIFRDQEGFIDPVSAANSTSHLLLGALSERVRLQSDMFVLSRAMGPSAPSITSLKDRIDGIDAQIEQLRGQLTGKSADGKTVSSALVRFEELDLQRIFAEKLYTLAQNALERARVRAQQKQLYLSVFVPPYLPEEAKYPERLALSVIVPLVLLIIWSIFALTAAAVEDHLR
jgi:capsular polysaccharide transport system permease protein